MPKVHAEVREQIRSMLETDQSPADWEQQLNELDSADLLHAVFQLKPDEQRQLLSAVSVQRAAHFVEEFPSAHSADLIEEMSAEAAAPIVEELASNVRVDVLSEMEQDDSAAILEQLEEEDVEEIRQLIAYPPDVAGG